MNLQKTREKHIEDINNVIDAIINLDGYYSQMPNDLSKALDTLNSLRSLAEEEIEEGDIVYDSFNNETSEVIQVGFKNFFFNDGKLSVGKKFCFKPHY